jgi:tRNA modification GTPase
MVLTHDTDTIAAIATAPGRGGIGIVRLSGPKAKTLAEALIGKTLSPRYAHYAHFRDTNNRVIDSGIALFFPGPRSFTGEDVVELQGHGGPVILAQLLAACLAKGARQARPGEFSERAFLHDKLDLVQAEAIADLINAQTDAAARQAQASLQGRFSERLEDISRQLIHIRKYVEAAIDFPEEEIDFLHDGHLEHLLDSLDRDLTLLRSNARQGSVIQAGATVVLAGKPNAGKSSLMNELAGNSVAIVTDQPGTTRDIVKEYIDLQGVPIRLTDTAGLRDSDDIIEAEGIKRARSAIAAADLILHLIDDSDDGSDELLEGSTPVLTVLTKIDLSGRQEGIVPNRPNTVAISVKTGGGMDVLKTQLLLCLGITSSEQSLFSARERHIAILDQVSTQLQTARDSFGASGAGELLAEDLRLLHDAFGDITGKMSSDELLGEIFSQFCIGK